ncbi:hypothetical protein Vretimale_8199 [Volvox reticuliferus]|uniref:RRM domain-containing protein n=1 Tax=Volvox reticuliferus TaxID=1737510 RepID=A0A8J4CMK5_9CHLO|nr:hypothetical protein Vretifemale_11767 [Volvox reticuliferus]GIM03676.1 hypothetical protein Vretimale_8199 [Volvox reticuliferus]
MANHAEDDALTFNGEIITHPNLYVRNLPPNMDQTAVEVMFRRFGTCTGCKFFKTAAVPYAFLRLGSPSEALAAIKAMNGTTVSGKIILVKPADTDATYDLPNENLYVRNIPVSWNEEDIRQFFEKYGPLVSVRVLPPIPTSIGQVAMVRFQQLEHAQTARDGANATTPGGEHLPLNVKFADHQDEKTRKQQSRLVKVGNGSNGPGSTGLHRYAPYPGASGVPGFPLPPPGAPMPMGMMESGEFMPFGPGGPGVPPPGAIMPPLEVMGDMGMPPPPWAGPGHPPMFGMQPPPPPPRLQQQPHQQQLQPQLQPQPQQSPVVAVAVDAASGQYMLTQPPGLGGPGATRSAQPQQPQPGIIPVVPLQPPALQTGQLQPLAQTPSQPQQPRPALQPGTQPQQPPGASLSQQQQPAGPKSTSSGASQQQAPYPSQPTQPPAASQPPAPTSAPSGAPQPYPAHDPQTAQHYAQQPYGAMPYGYPGNPHDPYAQAQVQQQQTYDAQAAAYYAAYYGHPFPSSYGHPQSQPGAVGGQQVPSAGQIPSHPGGAMPTDPYQAYYYYQQYCGGVPPQQQPQPQQQSQPQSQAPQQAYAVPAPANNAASSSTIMSGQQAGAATAAAASAVAAAQPLPQQQQQQPALPWNPQTAVQQTQPQPTSLGATAQKPQQQPAVAAASVPQQPIAHLNGPSATASGAATASGGPTTANGVGITANGTIPAGFKPSCRIMISNLPAEAEKLNLYESFAPYGAVLAVHVTNGFGVVQYADRDSAVRAAAAMNGAKVRGTPVKVVLAEA